MLCAWPYVQRPEMTRMINLELIRQLNDQIMFSLERIDALRWKALPGAIVYDDTGASRPQPTNKLERIFEMIDTEERKVNHLIDKRYKLKCEAVDAIQHSDLEIAARHILYLRYLGTDQDGRSLDWRRVIFYVNKYHNIQRSKIYKIHHDAVRIIKHYHI